MVRSGLPLESTILIAAHHGADNASSTCFIEAVKPKTVVFSAGSHDTFGHPSRNVVARFNELENAPDYFRTDFGDDEDHESHWEDSSTIPNCSDKSGDDDVLITLPDDGSSPTVHYLSPDTQAC